MTSQMDGGRLCTREGHTSALKATSVGDSTEQQIVFINGRKDENFQ